MQVVLRAREVVSRYYDGLLEADDELARAAGEDAANNSAGGAVRVTKRAAAPWGNLKPLIPEPCGHWGL